MYKLFDYLIIVKLIRIKNSNALKRCFLHFSLNGGELGYRILMYLNGIFNKLVSYRHVEFPMSDKSFNKFSNISPCPPKFVAIWNFANLASYHQVRFLYYICFCRRSKPNFDTIQVTLKLVSFNKYYLLELILIFSLEPAVTPFHLKFE